jgi:hypothetical protein
MDFRSRPVPPINCSPTSTPLRTPCLDARSSLPILIGPRPATSDGHVAGPTSRLSDLRAPTAPAQLRNRHSTLPSQARQQVLQSGVPWGWARRVGNVASHVSMPHPGEIRMRRLLSHSMRPSLLSGEAIDTRAARSHEWPACDLTRTQIPYAWAGLSNAPANPRGTPSRGCTADC